MVYLSNDKLNEVKTMGDRYLVTGAQLGAILVFAKEERPEEVKKLINIITENQFVGKTKEDINVDCNNVKEVL